jgi:hypothetical protein
MMKAHPLLSEQIGSLCSVRILINEFNYVVHHLLYLYMKQCNKKVAHL